MKKSTFITAGLFVTAGQAYPQLIGGLLGSLQGLGNNAVEAILAPPSGPPEFDAERQLIDVTGRNEWRAPRPGDARGPCPGLNALANHGFLPRNGFATILQFVAATTSVYGMGPDLAVILSAYGAVLDGNGLGWSIAGGIRTGIGGSRGHYETDNSPMRGDLNQYGSNTDLVLSQFRTFYDLQPDAATANYNIDVLSDFRTIRYNESIALNPWFYYGPFSGTSVSQAAFSFIFRFMANHTEANPEGILNQEVLKSFFAISGDSSSTLSWTPGHERIPNNWYRRGMNDAYSLAGLGEDTSTFARQIPGLTTPGCNQGEVNTYVAIDTSFSDYNFSRPLDGICFAVAEIIGVQNRIPVVSTVVQELILPVQNALGCIAVPALNQSVADTCPGYSYYGGPTGEIAPGAIQV